MKVARCHGKSYWSDVFNIILLRVHMKFIKVWFAIFISSDKPNTEFNFLENLKIQIFQNVNSTAFFIIVFESLSLWLWKDHAVRVLENNAKENKELWRRLHM